MNSISVMCLSTAATLPTRANPDDAGLDLYASENVWIYPGLYGVVPTSVAMDIAPGFVGLVRDRSSVSKTMLKVTAGVVDAGYRGSVDVVFLNLSQEMILVKQGQKIAQLLIIPVATPAVVQVTELNDTARGNKGFGSSGA